MAGKQPDAVVQRAHDDAHALLLSLGHRVEVVAAPQFDFPDLAEALYLVAGAAIANVVQTIDRTRSEPVQTHELEPFSWSLIEACQARGADALPWARRAIAAAVSSYREATRGFDVTLTPTLGGEPCEIGYLSPVLSRPLLLERTSHILGYTPIHNVAGCPAMSVPLHWSESGLPIGAHFAAAPGQDALLLGLAYQLEQARPWHERWPLYSIPRLFG